MYESLLPLIGEGSIVVANGAEGRRRHAMYSAIFTPTAIKRYYDIYNQVTLFFLAAKFFCLLFRLSANDFVFVVRVASRLPGLALTICRCTILVVNLILVQHEL